MTIEQRIRAIARRKIKVRITGKTRSKHGFSVLLSSPPIEGTRMRTGALAKSKREALEILLAKLRCFSEVEFSIEPLKVRPPSPPPDDPASSDPA